MILIEPEIFVCPSDPDPYMGIRVRRGLHTATDIKVVNTGVVLPLSYRGPCDTLEWNVPKKNYYPKRMTDWERPDKALLLTEGWPATVSAKECFRNLRDMATITYKPDYLHTWERHFGATNLLHMDGHISRYTPPEAEKLASKQEWSGGYNVKF